MLKFLQGVMYMLDKFNREINYLRISVTDRCNLRCSYCIPPGTVLKKKKKILSVDEIVEIVENAVKIGIKKIRLTGGEPLLRKDIVSIVKRVKSINGVEDLVMTTNGTLLKESAMILKEKGLDRINISLDTLDPEKYRELVKLGEISRVLDGIDAVIDAGFKGTKINMVVIPGFNSDEVEEMKEFCKKKGVSLQRINHYSLTDITSINRNYKAERPLECSQCNRIRLTADGKLKPCLFSDIELEVDFSDPIESLKSAVLNKPCRGVANTTKGNWEIGG